MPKSCTLTSIFLLFSSLVLCAAAQNTASKPASKPAPKTGTTTSTAEPQQGAPATAPAASPLATQKDKVSYAIGLNIGKGLHREEIEVDPNLILRGLKDGIAGGPALMTDEQAQGTMLELQAVVREKMETKRKQEGEANKKSGDAFLAANKAKPGVTTLPDGLQYKVLKAGTGPKPTLNDTVVCNYRGTLIDGKEFDSSYKRNEPAKFPVGGVIKGWTEALQLMPVGSKWELYLPPELAYGERGAGADIGPDSTLVFEVELLSIEPPAATPQSKPEEHQH